MFIKIITYLFYAFLTTLEIFGLTLVIALPLGLLVAFGEMSKFKPLRYLMKGIIWVIRGTPLMLQLYVVCYGPGLIGLTPIRAPMLAVIIAFSINYACYFAEIYRGGIESISKSQTEAGLVLGMTKSQIFFKVILLQVIKRIIPPMGNEIITLVKDTSLANVLGVMEIILRATDITGTYAIDIIIPLLYAGVYYLIFVGILTVILHYVEKKLSYFKA